MNYCRQLIAGLLPYRALLPCLVLLISTTAYGNLAVNGSFEAGIDSRLAIGRWYIDGLSAIQLDETNPYHGRYSLKIPLSRIAYVSKRVPARGIEVRSAVPATTREPGEYRLTAYVRGDISGKVTLSLLNYPPGSPWQEGILASREFRLKSGWQKIELSYQSDSEDALYWSVKATSDQPGHVWLDAVRLERDVASYPGHVEAELDFTVSVSREGAIFDAGSPVELLLRFYNRLNRPDYKRVTLTVSSLEGATVHRDELDIVLNRGEHRTLKTLIPNLPNGAYVARLSSPSANSVDAFAQFAVIPPPRSVSSEEGAFGIYGTIAPEPLRILRRAGFSWLANLTSNSRIIYWNQVEPFPGEFQWYDDDVGLARSLGFELMFNLEPCKTPSWAKQLSRQRRMEAWADYVRAMVEHYKQDVKFWTITDEVHGALKEGSWKRECWTSMDEYLPWHVVGARAIRGTDPSANIILNMLDAYSEELLSKLPPGSVDILGVNAWHVPEIMTRAQAVVRRHEGLQLWAPGIAVASRPWHSAHIELEKKWDYWLERNRTLTTAVIRSLALGTKKIFQYTGTHVGNTNIYSIFESDSSLKPIGVQFAALSWLLDGISSATRLESAYGPEGTEIYRFDRSDGRVVFPVWAADAPDQELVLSGLQNVELQAFDNMANRIALDPDPNFLTVTLGAAPVFLMTGAADSSAVEQAVTNLSVRMKELPRADRVQRAGRYAVLYGARDGAVRRKPDISLWYLSAKFGWREVLRYGASDVEPTYRATAAGIEIDWSFNRGTGKFSLEPGQFPQRLVEGATLWQSSPGPGDPHWISAVASRSDRDQRLTKTEARPSAVAEPIGLTTVIESLSGLQVILDTSLEGQAHLFDRQTTEPGGWRLMTRHGAELMLHQYYRAGESGPIHIHMMLRVQEEAR